MRASDCLDALSLLPLIFCPLPRNPSHSPWPWRLVPLASPYPRRPRPRHPPTAARTSRADQSCTEQYSPETHPLPSASPSPHPLPLPTTRPCADPSPLSRSLDCSFSLNLTLSLTLLRLSFAVWYCIHIIAYDYSDTYTDRPKERIRDSDPSTTEPRLSTLPPPHYSTQTDRKTHSDDHLAYSVCLIVTRTSVSTRPSIFSAVHSVPTTLCIATSSLTHHPRRRLRPTILI